ncbi:unnamed protein product, partial [Prorocentrum cordatum]
GAAREPRKRFLGSCPCEALLPRAKDSTYVKNKKCGHGVYHWADGAEEAGEYEEGTKHGWHHWRQGDEQWDLLYSRGAVVAAKRREGEAPDPPGRPGGGGEGIDPQDRPRDRRRGPRAEASARPLERHRREPARWHRCGRGRLRERVAADQRQRRTGDLPEEKVRTLTASGLQNAALADGCLRAVHHVSRPEAASRGKPVPPPVVLVAQRLAMHWTGTSDRECRAAEHRPQRRSRSPEPKSRASRREPVGKLPRPVGPPPGHGTPEPGFQALAVHPCLLATEEPERPAAAQHAKGGKDVWGGGGKPKRTAEAEASAGESAASQKPKETHRGGLKSKKARGLDKTADAADASDKSGHKSDAANEEDIAPTQDAAEDPTAEEPATEEPSAHITPAGSATRSSRPGHVMTKHGMPTLIYGDDGGEDMD